MQHIVIEEEKPALKAWFKRLYFVSRCHALTILMILLGCYQLHFVVNRQQDIYFFKRATILSSAHSLLYYSGFSFWIFLYLIYLRKIWILYVWYFKVFVTFLMAWLSIPLMWLPLLSSKIYEWYLAGIITFILMVFHSMLALLRKPFYDFNEECLIKWTIRICIASTLGMLAAIAWKSSETDVIVAVTIVASQTLLIIIFGRTIGVDAFFEHEINQNEYLYMILIHYNFISLFSQIILAFCKSRCVFKVYKINMAWDLQTKGVSVDDFNNTNWVETFDDNEHFEYEY